MKTVLIGMIVGLISGFSFDGPIAAGESPDPVEVAAAYLRALEARDLDAAGGLFARSSSIFETGGVEGDWAHYREHHLGPEIDNIVSIEIERKDPETIAGADGSLVVVTWPIEYTVSLKEDQVSRSRGTVTFVLIREDGVHKIRHLHWSSRRTTASP